MSASDSSESWWWIRSAEYVLGLLGNEDQKVFNKILEHDQSARQYVSYWQERFQPLSEYHDPVSPPVSVWSAIQEELLIELPSTTSAKRSNQTTGILANKDLSIDSDATQKIEPETTVKLSQEEIVIDKNVKNENGADLWRLVAASAVAAALFLGIVIKGDLLNRSDTQALAAFEAITLIKDERGVALWVVDSVARDKLIRVTSVESPEIETDKSFQLWLIKSDKTDEAGDISMGLLPNRHGQSALISAEGLTPDAVAYAVSMEPRGGSLVDGPSGPVLYQGSIQYLAK